MVKEPEKTSSTDTNTAPVEVRAPPAAVAVSRTGLEADAQEDGPGRETDLKDDQEACS